jgi:hypothetical protein
VRKRVALLAGAIALTLVVALGLGTGTGVERAAAANGEHHAAVIVSANGTVVRRVVTFTADSVSGLEALRAAGFDPVVYGFSGLGAAICALHVPLQGPVVGCPADNSCLTCASPNYWAYFEAGSGTSTFQTSRAGASSTRVHDGDVEGWKWGSGDPPPYTSVAALMGPAPGPVGGGPPAPAPQSNGYGSGSAVTTTVIPRTSGSGVGATTPSVSPGTAPAGTVPTTAASIPGGATTTTGRSGAAAPAQAAARRSSRGGGGSGGSAMGFALFGVVAAGLAVAVLLARRARNRA